MSLLPNDYYILVICPEVVIISDKHCTKEFPSKCSTCLSDFKLVLELRHPRGQLIVPRFNRWFESRHRGSHCVHRLLPNRLPQQLDRHLVGSHPVTMCDHEQSPEFKFRFVFFRLEMLCFSALCWPNEQKFGELLTWPKVIYLPQKFCQICPQTAEKSNIWRRKNANLNLNSGLWPWVTRSEW